MFSKTVGNRSGKYQPFEVVTICDELILFFPDKTKQKVFGKTIVVSLYKVGLLLWFEPHRTLLNLPQQ
jgi:hypothetical protein